MQRHPGAADLAALLAKLCDAGHSTQAEGRRKEGARILGMSFPSTLPAQPAPLSADKDGVIRVGSSRVTLDTVVGAFRNGCTAEEIVTKYPSLDLTDVYGTIAYYLWNRKEIDAYLTQREAEARTVRKEVELRHPSIDIRERLLARKRHAS